MYVLCIWMCSHQGCHLRSDLAYGRNVIADHAELNGIADRRAILQPVHPPTQHREIAFQQAIDPFVQHLARVIVFGHDHELSEVRMNQLLVERKIKTRAAIADIRDVVTYVFVAFKFFLKPLDLYLRCLERGALRQPQVDDQFRPVGRWKELILHESKAEYRERKYRDRDQDHRLAVVHAPVHYGPKTPVKLAIVDIAVKLRSGRPYKSRTPPVEGRVHIALEYRKYGRTVQALRQ